MQNRDATLDTNGGVGRLAGEVFLKADDTQHPYGYILAYPKRIQIVAFAHPVPPHTFIVYDTDKFTHRPTKLITEVDLWGGRSGIDRVHIGDVHFDKTQTAWVISVFAIPIADARLFLE